MDKEQAKTQLSIMISDTLQNVSEDRLTMSITSAWKDRYVMIPTVDSSIVYSSTKNSYTVPDTMTTIDSVNVKTSSDSFGEPLDSDLWYVLDGSIYFGQSVKKYLSDGNVLILKGKYKLTLSDPIPEEYPELQEYVVNLAALILLRYIGFSKALAFLSNDTSMSELIGFKREVERDVKALRLQIQNNFMDY